MLTLSSGIIGNAKTNVTGQMVAQNRFPYTYQKDSDGKKYDTLISSQTIDPNNLTVKP